MDARFSCGWTQCFRAVCGDAEETVVLPSVSTILRQFGPDFTEYLSVYPEVAGSTLCHPENCKQRLQVHPGCFRLLPSCPFRFRLLHTLSFLWPAWHYPRVRIQRSPIRARWDFNPHEQYAAQHTVCPADFCCEVKAPCDAFSHHSATRSRSPEVGSIAFRTQPPDLQPEPLMDMGFAVTCTLVRHLRSGSCTTARTFAPRFFQTPPLDDALALRYDFTSIRLSKRL